MAKSMDYFGADGDYPKRLIAEFTAFLQYFEGSQVKLTKASQFLARKDLEVLYAQVPDPKLDVPAKSNQPEYPLLHLFFHLALYMGLLQKKGAGDSVSATLNLASYKKFLSMTPLEQYVAMLDVFWTKLDWTRLQGHRYRAPDHVDILFEELSPFPPGQLIDVDKEDLAHLLGSFGHFLLYFQYFGFWNVTIQPLKSVEKSGQYLKVEAMELTPLFKYIEETLVDCWEPHMDDWLAAGISFFNSLYPDLSVGEDDEEDVQDDTDGENLTLFNMMQTLFPDGELNTEFERDEVDIDNKKYLFKVLWNRTCYRKIQLSGSHTLLDLHKLIQDAFDFDDDHLYAFYMDGKRFSRNCYNSPMDDVGPFVSDAVISKLRLYEKQKFLYLFDFGAEWKFTVTLLKVTDEENAPAAIVERKGESPSQYRW